MATVQGSRKILCFRLDSLTDALESHCIAALQCWRSPPCCFLEIVIYRAVESSRYVKGASGPQVVPLVCWLFQKMMKLAGCELGAVKSVRLLDSNSSTRSLTFIKCQSTLKLRVSGCFRCFFLGG